MKKNISPSLLSANFINLKEDIKIAEDLGVERLHLDVMDGHFVPNLTFGPFIIDQIRAVTNLHLETHLMIEDPHKYIKDYANAGSDTIVIHHESSKNVKSDLKTIRSLNKKAGIALNPDTPSNVILPYINYIDYILVMSVYPGFGGQSFIATTLDKMKQLVDITKHLDITIAVDGGVNLKTINDIYKTGINVTVVGSALYGAENITQRYKELTK